MNLQLADNKKISKEDSFVSYLLYNRRVRPIHKREILREIIESVKIYNENLLNKNLLFIYKDNKKFSYIETKFLKSNFYHLTGLESKSINPNYFYENSKYKKITYIDKNYHKEQELLKLMNELMGNESFE